MLKRSILLTMALAVGLSCIVLADAVDGDNRLLNGLPAAVGMNNKALGGSCSVLESSIWDYTPYKIPGDGIEWKWVKASGCPNIGLLVKTWGTVQNTYYSPTTGAKWFHIDDGSRVTSDLSDTGVIVYSDADVKKGQFVAVTGISGAEPAIDMPDKLVRTLTARTADDVQVLKEPVTLFPFSDEFDGLKRDWRWWAWPYLYYSNMAGDISLLSGELKMSISSFSSSQAFFGPYLEQYDTGGDWNLELKLSLEPALESARQGLVVAVCNWSRALGPADIESSAGAFYLAAVYTTQQTPGNPMHVSVAGRRDYCSGASDTWYFSIRKRGNTVFGSASSDGVNFSDEVESSCGVLPCLNIYTYSCPVNNVVYPVSGYIDYFRIKPVSE